MRATPFCAIDFGTSNSALSYATPTGMQLAELEPGASAIPTALFYNADDHRITYGRAAVATYVEGHEGRLLRSIKSILGSDLMDETTEIAPGQQVRYLDVLSTYLRHLKQVAERQCGHALTHAVIGRPVFFVDDNPRRDGRAEASLAQAALAAGFAEVDFEFEPLAAAFDYESRISTERRVLVADIGGGTSDFTILRAGPKQHRALDRRGDILANHGVHLAGTDFDRAVNLAAISPTLGLGTLSTRGQPVPSSIYHELATWHLINTCYTHSRMSELRQMRSFYADAQAHGRLMHVLQDRLGHELAGRAEDAKIAVATTGVAQIDLASVEAGLMADFDEARQLAALSAAVDRIAQTAADTATMAGLAPAQIDAIYFTGGSTGLGLLADRIAQRFPAAERIRGERLTSVVAGLAIAAQRRWSPAG
ncbi:MAG: Hsp70 family protein [Burkholderiaceae bacterium]